MSDQRSYNNNRNNFKPQDEFKDKVLDLRRVTRVVAGGKRFRFRATVVIGDGHGRVGVGVAKGMDVPQSIAKARAAAKKTLIEVHLKKTTIPHEVEAKFSAARIRIKPAFEGHGLRAGGAARTVFLLAGIKDVTAKTLGRTPNKLTNALAAVEALKKLQTVTSKSKPHIEIPNLQPPTSHFEPLTPIL